MFDTASINWDEEHRCLGVFLWLDGRDSVAVAGCCRLSVTSVSTMTGMACFAVASVAALAAVAV